MLKDVQRTFSKHLPYGFENQNWWGTPFITEWILMYLFVKQLVQAITERERLPPFLNKIDQKLLRYLDIKKRSKRVLRIKIGAQIMITGLTLTMIVI